MKHCRACKHHYRPQIPTRPGSNHWCTRIMTEDVISGKLMTSCEDARAEGGACGPSGRLFEEKWYRILWRHIVGGATEAAR